MQPVTSDSQLVDPSLFNNAKFHCLCPDRNFDPNTALGDIKVLSPLEPLHAAVLAFVEEHQAGMSEASYAEWMRLFRSVTCEFKLVDNKEGCRCILN